MVIVVMMKRSKNHLFPRSQTDLWAILPPYASTLIDYFLEKSKVCRYNKLNSDHVQGPKSSLDITPRWLSNLDLSAHLSFEPDFSAKFSSTKLILSHSYINVRTPLERIFNLCNLSSFSSLLPPYQVGETHFFPQLHWFCNTFWTKPTDKDFYQAWGPTKLRIRRYHVLETLYVPEVIRTELKHNYTKRGRYNLSLVISARLTKMASAYKQWFERH